MSRLVISGIDVSHSRLVELSKLADQAKPFYDWVTHQFQLQLKAKTTLEQMIQAATENDLQPAIARCYSPGVHAGIPILTDGVGRTYPHVKACYYFFSWLIRDAPQQRLG